MFKGTGFRLSASGFIVIGILFHSSARAEEVEFDARVLSARGLDPHIAESFSEGAKFPEGINRISLSVNGNDKGKIAARFNASGDLCLDKVILVKAKLDLRVYQEKGESSCTTLDKLWSQSTVRSYPDEGKLEFVVPESAIVNTTDYASWEHDGQGVLVNYDNQYMTSRSAGDKFNFWQTQTEAGFNVHDWVVRSTQSWSNFNSGMQFRHQNAWAQKTLYDIKSIFQAGRINLATGQLGGGRILGVQMTPDLALMDKGGAAVVEGFVDQPSVVEIRQQNVLLYRTTVPQGKYTLRNFSLINAHSDLVVTQTGSDGTKRQFNIPASVWQTGESPVVEGVAWGVGRWDQEGLRQHPMVATVAKGWQLLPRLGVQTEAFYAPGFSAIAFSSAITLPTGQLISLSSTGNVYQNRKGGLATAWIQQPVSKTLSVGFTGSVRTKEYREFSETFSDDKNVVRNRLQYGPSMNWFNPWIGNMSLSWTRSQQTDNSHRDYAQLGWTRRIGDAYVSVTAGRSQESLSGKSETRFYASMQIPLGQKNSVSNWMSHVGDRTRYGSRFSRVEDPQSNWSLSAEQDRSSGLKSVSGTISRVTPWSQFSANAGSNSDGTKSLSVQNSGGILWHQEGINLTPWRIGDTFGIARVGQLNNVKIDTPAGAVWTNSKGLAVLPALSSWQTSAMQIDTSTLKKGMDVANAFEEIRAARGSVTATSFTVIASRRVLLSVKDSDGKPLEAKAAVYDRQGHFLTVVSDDGSIFINDAAKEMELTVEMASGPGCRINLNQLSDEIPESSQLYEQLNAVCVK